MSKEICRPLCVLVAAAALAGSFGSFSQTASISASNATVSFGQIDGPAITLPQGPTNANSSGKVASIPGRFGLVRLATTNGQFAFEVTNFVAFGSYAIEVSSNLSTWTPIAFVYGPTNGLTVLNTNASGVRYFRVKETLPDGYARSP